MKTKAPDLLGQQYGRLTVVEYLGQRAEGKDRRSTWKCLCSCGKTHVTTGHSLRSGNTQSCGCLRDQRLKENWLKASGKSRNGDSAKRSAIAHYKNSSKRKNHVWGLTDTQAEAIMVSACYYCGTEPDKVEIVANCSFTHGGIDRVDSLLGYTLDNVVPCCMDCNRMKNRHSKDFFFSHIERILNHQKKSAEV